MIVLKIAFTIGWLVVATILAASGAITIQGDELEVPLWAAWLVGPGVCLLIGMGLALACGVVVGVMTLPIWIWLL